jgi:hypothetical protein
VNALITVTGPAELDPCPYCGGISGVQVITGTPPTVQAWSCGECGTEWAITVVNPRLQSFLDRLTATVVLRGVIALADEAFQLSDDQLRARLAGLVPIARSAVTDSPLHRRGPGWPPVEGCPRIASWRPAGSIPRRYGDRAVSGRARPRYDPWRDTDGTPIPEGARVEQIAAAKEHGAHPARVHQQGTVI